MKHFFTIFILLMFLIASTLSAQINWTKHPNPVLTPGPTGEWDEEFVGFPSVLFDGYIYHMWYGNYNYVTGAFERIGYATSGDGIIWAKYDDPTTTNPPFALSDPVLNPGLPGTYDDEEVSSPSVLLIGSTYHMWYSADDDSAFWGHSSICHATSPNGITWTKDDMNNPVLDVGSNGTWDDVWVWAPCVVFDGSIYHMWYCANSGDYSVRIGHATSPQPDGPWTKDANNPILDIGSSTSWDYDRVDAPNVVFDGRRFHMWYSGGYYTAWRIGYAWSTDGSNWDKYNNNPVVDWGLTGTFDDTTVSHCSVLLDTAHDTLKMWYLAADTGYGTHFSVQVGYATSPFDTSFISGINKTSENFPKNYVLKQNYPNPFNPRTNIEFSIPKTEFVTLKIYNLLGQEVATLVSDKLTLGNYKYTWDASGFASGVYLYKIEAGSYVQTRKLILMK